MPIAEENPKMIKKVREKDLLICCELDLQLFFFSFFCFLFLLFFLLFVFFSFSSFQIGNMSISDDVAVVSSRHQKDKKDSNKSHASSSSNVPRRRKKKKKIIRISTPSSAFDPFAPPPQSDEVFERLKKSRRRSKNKDP